MYVQCCNVRCTVCVVTVGRSDNLRLCLRQNMESLGIGRSNRVEPVVSIALVTIRASLIQIKMYGQWTSLYHFYNTTVLQSVSNSFGKALRIQAEKLMFNSCQNWALS